MLHLLYPDIRTASYREITPELLRSLGARALICDIDNTLVTYDDPIPTPELSAWFELMEQNGIKVGFVSNNNEARVSKFNESLGYFAIADSGKPSTRGIRAALADMKINKNEALVVGDQVFTDVLSAKRAGLRVILVPPIKDKKTLLFRFKRALEVPILAAWERKQKQKSKREHK